MSYFVLAISILACLITESTCYGKGRWTYNNANSRRIVDDNKDQHENIFTKYYETNFWQDNESRSGDGSSLKATEKLRTELPKLFDTFEITSILDAACGDFNWMRTVDLGNRSYLGVDIVKPAVDRNNELYGTDKIRFSHLSVVSDQLPQVDLIICRDFLIHLTRANVIKTLTNLKKSKAHYLLATTYTSGFNKKIPTGGFRPINLEKPPYNFPKPLLYLEDKKDHDPLNNKRKKKLGLWLVKDIPDYS